MFRYPFFVVAPLSFAQHQRKAAEGSKFAPKGKPICALADFGCPLKATRKTAEGSTEDSRGSAHGAAKMRKAAQRRAKEAPMGRENAQGQRKCAKAAKMRNGSGGQCRDSAGQRGDSAG